MRRSLALLSLFTILFFSALCGASNVHAQAKQNQPQQTAAANTSPQETALDREVQVIREYDARMQETVYWSLGVVVLLLILLGGFSWYTNFRVYERDLANLRNEIRLSIERESLSLKEEVTKLTSIAQSKAASHVRKEIGNIHHKLESKLSRREMDRFEVYFLELRIQVEEMGTEKYPILRDNVLLLEACLQLGLEHNLTGPLTKIEDLIKQGQKLFSMDIARLVAALDKLPKHLVPKGESVRVLIAAATRDEL